MTMKQGDPGAPWDEAAAVVASDSTTFNPATRGLYIGTSGDVAVTMAGPSGGNVTFFGVPAGAILPVCVTKVLATGTSAGSITRGW